MKDEATENTECAADDTEHGRLETLDRRATLFLYEKTRNPVFEILMPAMSIIANRGALHILAGVCMLIFGGVTVKAAALAMLASTAVAGLIAELPVKMLWKRRRPFMVIDDIEPKVPHRRLLKRPSFPSGHASGYFASGMALAMFFPQWSAVFLIIAALGAFSRIYNGVHFLSDVTAGSIVGILTAIAVTVFFSPFFIGVFD